MINGLGLSIAVQIALANPEVSSVAVIEIPEDVKGLVPPHISDSRPTVIHADAHNWMPPKGMRWNIESHDIWDDICPRQSERDGKAAPSMRLAGQLLPRRVRPRDMAPIYPAIT